MLVWMIFILSLQIGRSDSCPPGQFWFSDKCYPCPPKCATCTHNTLCHSCNVGYYGTACWEECSPACHKNRCSQSGGRCTCNGGYYPNGPLCVSCPQNCYTCKNETICLECNTGYYGQSCETNCSSLCRGGCNKDDGECSDCIEEYYKEVGQCKKCSNGCATCQNKDGCSRCQYGYFLNQTKKDSNVKESCISCHKCNNLTDCVSREVCYQCLDGFWGPYCGNKCNDTCRRCVKSIGECIACENNTYGLYCELKCSRNCLQLSDTNSSCWKNNGTCTDGCVQGVTGPKCTVESSSSTSPQFIIIVGSISGVVAFIVATVAVVILLRRRRASQTGSNVQRGRPTGSKKTRASGVLNQAYEDSNDATPTVSGHGDNSAAVSVASADVYSVVQKNSPRKQATPNKINGHEVQAYGSENVYDVSGAHGSDMRAGMKMSQVEGDTYSHISHATRARQLHHDDERAYDNVTRHNLQKGQDDNTYDVTGESDDHNYHAPEAPKHSSDEYSTIRHVQ